MPKITVLPAEKSAEVESGELLLEAGEKAGVEMEAGCFNCSCGTCVVAVVSGMENLEEPTPEELDVLDSWNKDPEKYRLTCCVKIKDGEVVIRQAHCEEILAERKFALLQPRRVNFLTWFRVSRPLGPR